MAMVTSGPFAGAEMMTFFAPAPRCLLAPSRSVNRPVHSSTRSTPIDFQGSLVGSFSAVKAMVFPSTVIALSVAETCPGQVRCTESYLKRWAIVAGASRSLMATNSMFSFRASAARRMQRPIRPNPLIATFMVAMGRSIRRSGPGIQRSGAHALTASCPQSHSVPLYPSG